MSKERLDMEGSGVGLLLKGEGARYSVQAWGGGGGGGKRRDPCFGLWSRGRRGN